MQSYRLMAQQPYMLLFVFVIALHLSRIMQNIEPSRSEYLSLAQPFNQFYTLRLDMTLKMYIRALYVFYLDYFYYTII